MTVVISNYQRNMRYNSHTFTVTFSDGCSGLEDITMPGWSYPDSGVEPPGLAWPARGELVIGPQLLSAVDDALQAILNPTHPRVSTYSTDVTRAV